MMLYGSDGNLGDPCGSVQRTQEEVTAAQPVGPSQTSRYTGKGETEDTTGKSEQFVVGAGSEKR